MHMFVRWCTALLLISSSPPGEGREDRSLVNTFPFTLNEDLRQDLAVARQLEENAVPVDFNSVAQASSGGQRCIDKIVMEEETEYDEVYECNHSYNRRCHISYTTSYTAQQEEECEDNYKKNCFIQYSPTAYNVTVQICREPLVKDCSVEGPTVCSTEYQSECETTQHEHQVEDDIAECRNNVETKCFDVTSGYTTSQECSSLPIQKCDINKKSVTKYSPETTCRKVPIEICGPSACPAVPGPQECYETTKTITGEKPEEECSLEPRQACKHVTKLVPQLLPKESCVDVPKEICARSLNNPRRVNKPVIKRWCYTPTPESGLSSLSDVPSRPDNQGASSNQGLPVSKTCPRSCEESKRSGTCDPRCNEYAVECGIPVCQPTTPSTTTTTTTTTTTVPRCPATCRPGFQRNGSCQPECDIEECGYDPDCEPVPYDPPVTTTPQTTSTQPTTTAPPSTTALACPAVCRPGFQSNGVCEVQCHSPVCGFDPDCNVPVTKPDTAYLPPASDACPPNSPGCGKSVNVVGLAPPASRRSARQNFVDLTFATAKNTAPAKNNWDLFWRNGLIAKKG